MERIVLLLFFFGIAFLIAYFLGRKRQIGFGFSFFFCVFLSPIGGFITTMLSRKYYDPNPEPSKAKKMWGRGIVIFCVLSLLGQFGRLTNEPLDAGKINTFFLTIGLIGLGFYLIELSKGKNFNSNALTKTNL